jgi:hypothetical protein
MLSEFNKQFESGGQPDNAPKAIVELFHRATEALRQSELAERALKTGDRAPAFTLNNQDETRPLSLNSLQKARPPHAYKTIMFGR